MEVLKRYLDKIQEMNTEIRFSSDGNLESIKKKKMF